MSGGPVSSAFDKLKEHAANYLTNSVYNPNSKIPEYKICAVRLEKIERDA